MLPDFPHVKQYASQILLRWTARQVPALSPLLSGISTQQQHEGARATIVREDASVGEIEFAHTEFGIEIPREEMKQLDLERLTGKLREMAQQIADHQEKLMLEEVSAAANEVGNTIDAGGRELQAEHFLEMLRRIQTDFDPVTLKPKEGQVFVVHPSLLPKLLERTKTWEQDPAFKAELARIEAEQLEAWRAREDRRILVD